MFAVVAVVAGWDMVCFSDLRAGPDLATADLGGESQADQADQADQAGFVGVGR